MTLARDIRLAIRSLVRAPSFSIVAVLAVALGIGSTVAVFGVADAVMLSPLGYRDADRLVSVEMLRAGEAGRGSPSYADFLDWRAQSAGSAAFDGLAFARGEGVLLRGTDGPESVIAAYVSEDFFEVLGARPLLGRTFSAEEERPGAERTVVLKHELWMTRFGGDPAIVGKPLPTRDGVLTIIGVMGPEVDYPAWAQLYMPIAPLVLAQGSVFAKRDFRVDNRVIGRLRAGVTLDRAHAELGAIARRLADAHPAENEGWGVTLAALRDEVVGPIRPALVAIGGAVVLVLLIACANVANLSLVRASGRSREISVRMALGAGRWQLARQMLAESTVVALAGGALGLLLAQLMIGALRTAAPANLPRLDEIAIDGRVLAFAAASCALSALLFGLAPALQLSTSDLAASMREGSAGAGRGRGGRRLRAAFVVLELALALVLLVGTGLLIRSFAKLTVVDPGIDVERLLTLRVEPAADRYDSPERLLALYQRLREEISALPGVRSASIINHLPLTGAAVVSPFEVDGVAPARGAEQTALFRVADDRYFATAGHRIVAGRDLTATDMSASSRVVIVSESMARRLWPGTSAVGHRVSVFKQAGGRPDYNERIDAEVVGVAADTKLRELSDDPFDTVYLPLPLNPWRSAFLVVRAESDPAALAASVRRAVTAVDADIPVGSITTVAEIVDGRFAPRRFAMTLLGAFAATALLLATIGVYGVIAFGVSQRTREIGIRGALGASRGALMRLFVAEGFALSAIGVALGAGAAVAGTRLLASMVYGVGVHDAATFAGVAVLLVLVAMLASWIPARRAARVDPLVALRAE